MVVYTIPFTHIINDTAANTAITLASIIAGPTEGFRATVIACGIGNAGDAVLDEPFFVDISRIEDLSAGAAGTLTAVAVANIARSVSRAANPRCSAAHTYTVEPTAYDAEALWAMGLNSRGQAGMTWTPDTGPTIDNDQILGFRITGGIAAGATESDWTGYMSWVES